VFQRPLHYLAYVLVAIIFSGICWIVAIAVTEGVIRTAWWATSWGSNVAEYRTGELSSEYGLPPDRIDDDAAEVGVQDAVRGDDDDVDDDADSTTLDWGRRLIWFWNGVARSIGAAFLYGLFWCITAAVYLLLRKDLDGTELDEIHVVEDPRQWELPALRERESGVPVGEEHPTPPGDEPPAETETSD
jgi:hypothetical protein